MLRYSTGRYSGRFACPAPMVSCCSQHISRMNQTAYSRETTGQAQVSTGPGIQCQK